MSPGGIAEYTQVMRGRYGKAGKRERGGLLDEFCRVTGYHRKAAVRAPNRKASPAGRRRGRPRSYGLEVTAALLRLWEASDRLCSKRLVAFLPELVAALERHGELGLEPKVREQVLRLSAATSDRRLRPHRQAAGRRGYTQSKANAALKALVPLRTFGEWAGVAPGACQADLVAHCGESVSGFYLNTLMVVDVATSWSDFQAVWGKGYQRVQQALHRVGLRLPMGLRELHSDNGGEFLNHPLVSYCHQEGIRFTRGRAYRKNDQAYVEQKNGGVIRRWVGYDRYASRAAYAQLEQLYRSLRLYVNFFQPVRKLVAKERVGAKMRKRYDRPQTPYRRLLEANALSPEQRQELASLYERLNPLALQRDIQAGLTTLWRLAERPGRGAASGNPNCEAVAAVR